MEEKIKALYSDKSFTDELSSAKSFEEAATLFASHGVVVSAQELEDIAKEAMTVGEGDLAGIFGCYADKTVDLGHGVQSDFVSHTLYFLSVLNAFSLAR
jgi:hypothetical protein